MFGTLFSEKLHCIACINEDTAEVQCDRYKSYLFSAKYEVKTMYTRPSRIHLFAKKDLTGR